MYLKINAIYDQTIKFCLAIIVDTIESQTYPKFWHSKLNLGALRSNCGNASYIFLRIVSINTHMIMITMVE